MTAAIKGVHPLAEIWPKMIEDDFEDLVKSISDNGLRNPIVITPDGLILDGVNRHAACKKAKVTPTTVIYEGEDLAEFILDSNSSRRHMNSGARTMAAAMTLAAVGRRKGGRWIGWTKDGTCEQVRKSAGERKAFEQCGLVIDHAPDLAPQVVSSKILLKPAFEQAQERKQEKDKTEKHLKALQDAKADKFLRLIDDGELTVESAFAAYQKENEKELKFLEELRKADIELYSGVLMALGCIAGYSEHDSDKFMERYNPEDLTPLEPRFLTIESLEKSRKFVENMIEWVKNNEQ